MSHNKQIVSDPGILLGKPVISGTRIPVELVLAKLSRNPDLGEFFADYPELSLDDVKACLSYAAALVKQESRRIQPRRP